MDDEDALLPISALQHLLFCERQCALIHLEGLWLDNALTVEGSYLHRRADDPSIEARGDTLTARSMPLRCLRLGIVGRADVVEFVRCATDDGTGVHLPGRAGRWLPKPVEYKRGRPKAHRADEVQLCAQALCLEEVMSTTVESGDLYYGAKRRRSEVPFDTALRSLTERTIIRLRALLTGDTTPQAVYERKCDSCSLMPVCMPRAPNSVRAYLAEALGRGS